MKICLTVLCARNLPRQCVLSLPNPFVRVTIVGSAFTEATKTCHATVNPDWNQHFFFEIGDKDSILLTVWDQSKLHHNHDDDDDCFVGSACIEPADLKVYIESAKLVSLELLAFSRLLVPSISRSTPALTSRNARKSYVTIRLTSQAKQLPVRAPTVGGVPHFAYYGGGGKTPFRHQMNTVLTSSCPPVAEEVGHLQLDSTKPDGDRNTERIRQSSTSRRTSMKKRRPEIALSRREDRRPAHETPTESATTSAMMSSKRDEGRRRLARKIAVLRTALKKFELSDGSKRCVIDVSRGHIFEDSYKRLMKMKPKHLRRRLMVRFIDEDGIDAGGLAREWMYLLSREMLNPAYGLFLFSNDDNYTIQINPDSGINPDHLSYFRFVGRIIGTAIYHGHQVDGGGCFTSAFYRELIGKQVSLTDVKTINPDLYRSFVWLLNNEISADDDRFYFVVDDVVYGQQRTHELVPNGMHVAVTEQNKSQYIRLYINRLCLHGCEKQFTELKRGIDEIVPIALLRNFDESELSMLITGLTSISVTDWKRCTRLKYCDQRSKVVRWFWRAVEQFNDERRAMLLQFVTGSPRVPGHDGHSRAPNGPTCPGTRHFTIQLMTHASTDQLPKAHTCFNRIEIPQYETYEKFLEKIIRAIEETSGFTME